MCLAFLTDECFYKRLGRGLLGAPLILVLVIVVYFLLFASFTVGGDALYHLIVRTRRGSWATSFEVASIQRLIQILQFPKCFE